MIVSYRVTTDEGRVFFNDAHATGGKPTRANLQRFIKRLSALTYRAGYTPRTIEVEVQG